jgi:glycosidase
MIRPTRTMIPTPHRLRSGCGASLPTTGRNAWRVWKSCAQCWTNSDRTLAGEVQGKISRIGHFYGNDRLRLHLPLNFALLDTPWDALSVQGTIDAYLKAVPDHGWPDWVVGGHDKRRVASRIGPAQARILAMVQQDPRSLLWLYRSLIRLRKQEKALTAGSYVPMRSRNDVLMFKRSYGDTELLVALNFSHDPCKLPFDPTADLLISTHLDREPGVVQSSLILRGDEGVILRVSERRT